METTMESLKKMAVEFVMAFVASWVSNFARLVKEGRMSFAEMKARQSNLLGDVDLMCYEVAIEKTGARIVTYGQGKRFRDNKGRQCVFLMDGNMYTMYLSEIDCEYKENEAMIGKYINGKMIMLDEVYCKRGYKDLEVTDENLLKAVLEFVIKHKK